MWAKVILAVVISLPFAACESERPADLGNQPMVSSTIDVICNADGTTELRSFNVVTRPDGVHFHVDNRAGETTSLNGTGRDFRPGVSEQASLIPPGEYEIACWPGSLQNGEEPETQTIRVTDPDGLYVRPWLKCPEGSPASGRATLDYGAGTPGVRGDPVTIATRVLHGLKPDDEIILIEYPEAEFPEIAVVRNGDQIVHLGYSPRRKAAGCSGATRPATHGRSTLQVGSYGTICSWLEHRRLFS